MTQLGTAPQEQLVGTFAGDLDGEQVRPPEQDTQASGHATLRFIKQTGGGPFGGNIILFKMHFEVTAEGIDGVTSVHVHGPSTPDEVGPVLAVLFESPDGTGAIEGELASDSIPHMYGFEFSDDRIASGTSVEHILDLSSQELVYVDVHTLAHPDGEIRGSVR